jgi:glycosyltransferase involved in cell wall biosynthesis
MGVIFGSEMFGRDPGYAQELHRRAAMPDLQGAVVFAGYQPDAARLLPAFDMAVHCSRDPEPFGQVVFEALAAGVPVIAAPAGGPGEVLQDGEEALLVPPAVESLAAALARLAGEPEMRARLAQAGRHRVESGLTAEAMTRAYERAWLRALGPD